jgi:phosphoglycolate phosphatase-like HAD superfamily hydrolase
MTLQALLFDVDGTLADTERDGHRPAFNQAFKEAGLDWHWDVELYGKLLAVTGGKERMKHYIDHYRPDYSKPANFDEMSLNCTRSRPASTAPSPRAAASRCVPASSAC